MMYLNQTLSFVKLNTYKEIYYMNTTNYTDAQLDQIQMELNALGINDSNKSLTDSFFVEFDSEIKTIETVLSKWISTDKAERLARKDFKETKAYSKELAENIDLNKLSRVILIGLMDVINTIHDQPNGKSDNGNPHFQMLIDKVLLQRSLPMFGFEYKSDKYAIKMRLGFWNRVIHNILLETTHCFEVYKGKALSAKDSGYWLIKYTEKMELRVKPFNVSVKFSIHRPMVVPPIDWTSVKEGGYYTTEMQRKSPLSRHHDVIPQTVLDAVNKIQAVPFTISPEGIQILNTLSKVKRAQIKELKQQIKAIKAQLLEVDITPEA
jgi:hypothetical protein